MICPTCQTAQAASALTCAACGQPLPAATARAATISAPGLIETDTEQGQARLWRTLVERLPIAIYLASADSAGATFYISPQVQSIVGFSADEWVADPRLWSRLVHAEDRDRVLAAYRRCRTTGAPFASEYRLYTRSGAMVWVRDSAVLVSRSADTPAYVLGTWEDITARMTAEAALRESQRMLATLMSNLPGLAYRCRNDPDWTIEFVSEGCHTLTGYRAEQLMGRGGVSYGQQIVHPEDRDAVWQAVQTALQAARPFELTYRIRTASGEEKVVWEQGQGVFASDGALLALEGFVTDVTAQQRAEDALRQAHLEEGRLQGIVFAAREMAHLLNNDLALPVGVLDLLGADHALAPPLRQLVSDAAQALGQATAHVQQFQQVVRVETKPTPQGPALDLHRSTRPADDQPTA